MMDMKENPKLDGVSEEKKSIQKISILDLSNGFQYTPTDKSDSFSIDMESFSHGVFDKEMNPNPRITRSLSRKGSPPDSFVSSSPRGSCMPEKPTVVVSGTTGPATNQQVHHQITITTGSIAAATESRFNMRRNICRLPPPPWLLDPKRILMLFVLKKRSKRSQIRVGAMTADEGKVKIEKFDGADFGFWKMQIEDFLYQKNLYQPLSGKQPEGMKNEDWALLDRQALGVIQLTLSRNVTFNIAKEKTTAGFMTTLSSMYEKPSASNKVHLMRRLFNLRMKEGASVAQHLNELNTITTQLSSVEIEFDDEVRALILLSSLPDSWNATVTAVNSLSGNSKLKFDDVRDLVLSEEIRRRESGEASTSSALHTESRGRTSERIQIVADRNPEGEKSRTGNKDFTCYNCGKKGHFKRDCRAPKKNTGAQESANMTEETSDAMILSVNSPIESWILDSGASFHSTSCQEIMENYVSGDFGKVHLADDETLKIVGKGDIRLKLPNQTTWKLTGVRHIPGLKRNLISVGQLDGEGYSTTFSVVDADGKSNLWHQRLGHMSEKGMKTLLSKGKLPDLKNVDVGLCEDCLFGKQKKAHLYVTFIDDSTRKVWVYFLKKKSEVFDTFRKWKAMVENENDGDNSSHDTAAEWRSRAHETLNERARSMRNMSDCPNFYGLKLLTCSLPDQPWALSSFGWQNTRGSLEQERNKPFTLRVFGCISYVHIDSAERSKLDAKSNKCAFVGYDGDEFGYRFWDYENRKIIRSRNVIFNENVMYKDRSTVESSSSNTKAETKELLSLRRFLEMMFRSVLKQFKKNQHTETKTLLQEFLNQPNGKKALHNKWIYRIKEEHEGSKRYKARLVVKAAENLHLEQLDVKTAFLHVVKLSTIRLVLKIVAAENLHLEQLDVKAFLHGLKKSLYGLKQAPRQWYKKFDSFMSSSGFTRCQADHCFYIKRFNMQDAKPVSTPLGVHFRLSKEQSPKTEEERAHVVKVSYASAIGSLMYAMVCTRPDIAQAVGAVSRRSTTGYVYTLRGTTVSWVSQLQKIVALSITEAEHIAVTKASKEMVWLQRQSNTIAISFYPVSSGRWDFENLKDQWSSKSGKHVDKDGDYRKTEVVFNFSWHASNKTRKAVH
ncbi:Detected protein of unknown function [Hibiscus syriacus]|uniref:CCHC-type domain-containing protein n=1 Tax=Hibiscus syriacus TaxID=106335 RepID=A0A6A3B0Z1_HIBSY|nr:Detected protein of unknown function [Hibiscus syriacus]